MISMCWNRRWKSTSGWTTTCELVMCYICWNKVGLICNSTDLKYNDKDVVVCGVCYDIHIDRIIETVLTVKMEKKHET